MKLNTLTLKAGSLLSGIAVAVAALSMQPGQAEAALCTNPLKCPPPARADLRLGATSLTYGGNGYATYTFEVVNAGAVAAAPSTTSIVARDNWGSGYAGKTWSEGSIAPGGKVTRSFTFWVHKGQPGMPPGGALHIALDQFNTVIESNEANNSGFVPFAPQQ